MNSTTVRHKLQDVLAVNYLLKSLSSINAKA